MSYTYCVIRTESKLLSSYDLPQFGGLTFYCFHDNASWPRQIMEERVHLGLIASEC